MEVLAALGSMVLQFVLVWFGFYAVVASLVFWRRRADVSPPRPVPQDQLTPDELWILDQAVLRLTQVAPGWRPLGLFRAGPVSLVLASDGVSLAEAGALVAKGTGQLTFSGLCFTTLLTDGRRIETEGLTKYFHFLPGGVTGPADIDGRTVVGWTLPEVLTLHRAQLEDAAAAGRRVQPMADPVRSRTDNWVGDLVIYHPPYGYLDATGRGRLRFRTAVGAMWRLMPPVRWARGVQANRRVRQYLTARSLAPVVPAVAPGVPDRPATS